MLVQKRTYYRNESDCEGECHCHVLADQIRLTEPLNDCECGCTWSDEPPGAGRDPFGRPDPRTHPEFWTE